MNRRRQPACPKGGTHDAWQTYAEWLAGRARCRKCKVVVATPVPQDPPRLATAAQVARVARWKERKRLERLGRKRSA